MNKEVEEEREIKTKKKNKRNKVLINFLNLWAMWVFYQKFELTRVSEVVPEVQSEIWTLLRILYKIEQNV